MGTSLDYATVAYGANGNQLWVARYHGPAADNEAHAIAVDVSGNVYVTGGSAAGSTGLRDYATVAYDSSGNQLWVARYDGPAHQHDVAQAIALDASGNVYVTGFSDGGATRFDYATVAYDANGNQLWVARYDGPAHQHDVAQAIALDASGNVYVTGRSFGAAGFDYATVAYDANGNQLWVARYDGPGDDNEAHAIAVDASGNVYVTGGSAAGSTGLRDYATVAYDSSGNQLWVARYHGPANDNEAHAIAVDASGNVYVTGQSFGAAGSDYATVAYDSNGNQLWAALYHGPSLAHNSGLAIGLDASGNVYVTGQSGSTATSSAYATVKYLVGACPLGAENSLRQPNILLEGETAGASCPTLTCGTVMRGSTVNCAVTNYGSGTLSNWRFTEGTNTVRGSGSSATWSGTAVQSGTVRVDVTAARITTTLRASLTVNPRTGWAFTAVPPQKVDNGRGTGGCAGILVTMLSPPQTFSDLGQSCLFQNRSWTPNTVSSGPNNGYNYTTTLPSNTTIYQWQRSPDLDNTGSVFYSKQTGSYDPQTNPFGCISGVKLATQTQRHEIGSVQGHWGEYKTSQDNLSNNVGTIIEGRVGPPSQTQDQFQRNLNSDLDAAQTRILNDTRVEPYGANFDENGNFLGNVNFAPAYNNCQ